MSKGTWRDGEHHYFDKHAREEMLLIEVAYGNSTIDMKGPQHVKFHRNTREFGRIGAVARYDLELWKVKVF